MNKHLSQVIILTHLTDPKSTMMSVGALYAMCIAAQPKLSSSDWEEIHNAMTHRFQPKDNRACFLMIDTIKKHGWRLHSAVSEALKNG